MPYLVIEDFKHGVDRRRERVAGVPGTLWVGKNVHVSRGGDIQRRKKFVATYDVTGSFGEFAIRSQRYVFGSADLASTMPIGILYQRLQSPSGAAMTRLLDVKSFAGKIYAIAEYADGNVYHFYDGTRVEDWDIVAEAGADFSTVAEALADKIESDAAVTAAAFENSVLITARTAGTAFTIAKATIDGGGTNDQDITLTTEQANVAEVAEVRASCEVDITGGSSSPGVNQVSAITINGVAILSAGVDWSGSDAATAILLASAITAGYATHGYSAEASGTTVTIQAAPGTGTTPNGYEVIVTTIGDVTVTADAELSGGVVAVEAQAQVVSAKLSGTFEAEDLFTITINGTDYKVTGLASATGRTVSVSNHRMWSPVGSLMRYCMLDRPDVWDPDSAVTDADAGFLNVASETEGNDSLVVGARYQGQTAFFSGSNVTLFQLDTDPANWAFSNSLENTGTVAPGSVVRYGNNDVFYLDRTGIRSLRSRDGTDAPFVSDIGNAIDTFVQDYVKTLNNDQIRMAIAAIEPEDGRYWLTLGGRIFVLSFFPGAKISAWSWYEPDEFDGDPVQAIVRVGRSLDVRAGDHIYVFGGVAGDTYPDEDESIAEVELPFLSGKTPATIKAITGYDMAGTNTWEVSLAFDPNAPDKTINVGRISEITFADRNKVKVPGDTSMVAPKLVCRKAGAATISQIAIHYEGEDAPG